jgi:tetratricopeptide (TPR) repeat protein
MGLASADIVPMTIKAGICYKYDKLSVPFEIENTQADNVFSSGFERWFYSDQLAVRSGLQIGTRNLANISAGLSYSYRNSVRLDYGFSFPLQGIKNTYGSHRFSLVFLFDKGGSKSQTKPQIKSQVKLDEKIKPNTSKFDKAVKLYKKNELIRAYDLFKEVSILNRDPKLRTDSIKHVNIIVKKLKAVQEKRALDKRYYYADGLLNYMYNKYSDALRSWKEYIKLDKNNSEVNQYINDLQKAQDLF